jgi:hypothetical protein
LLNPDEHASYKQKVKGNHYNDACTSRNTRALLLLRCHCPFDICMCQLPWTKIQMIRLTFSFLPPLCQVSVSVPTWNNISFLNVGAGAGQVRYGVFGYTGSKIAIGYYFLPIKYVCYSSPLDRLELPSKSIPYLSVALIFTMEHFTTSHKPSFSTLSLAVSQGLQPSSDSLAQATIVLAQCS